jgi:hypothetical protein
MRVIEFTDGPLPFVKFLHEVLDGIWNRGGRWSSLPRPKEATPASAEGRGSLRVLAWTCWATQIGARRPTAARPRQQAAATVVARWQRPLVKVKAGKEALRVRHGVAMVVVAAARHEKA